MGIIRGASSREEVVEEVVLVRSASDRKVK